MMRKIYVFVNTKNSAPQIRAINDLVEDAEGLELTYEELTHAEFIADDKNWILENAAPGATVVTSTMANFSADLISAIDTIKKCRDKGIHVIATQEKFDSDAEEGERCISLTALFGRYRKSCYQARRERQIEGIKQAAKEGKYKGRKKYTLSEFPQFEGLYREYMGRDITKREFAQSLKVSRPTLDRLIREYREGI